MDYDFSRLSTRSFEQMIQALAASVIGPGAAVFGDGPDGGREATFEGRLSFPDPVDPWHGYVIVQAKFRQRPEGGGKDGDWALAELRKELEKYTRPDRKLRKPDYYLFVTNVVLTPVAELGGKDKLVGHLEAQKKTLGLKDFRVWDYDQLRTFLDMHIGVRTAYSAWITPGDVLAAVLEQIKLRQADFGAVMLNYVQKELRAEQYVRLGAAGHSEQDRIPLARVFVDLPIGEPGADAPPAPEAELDGEGKLASLGAVSSLLLIGAQRLDSASNELSANRANLTGAETATQVPGRIVFIGGPGQGKSTLGQFLCQLHRAAFLDGQAVAPLPEIRDTCELIRRQCVDESLTLPRMPRFPVRVELNAFAAKLADSTTRSLFDYLLQRICQRAERELSADDLRTWLERFPWLVVLDGLDEVPASSNRSEVLAAIQDFLVDAHCVNADLMLLATTRPQGYSDDFSSRYYRHHQLLPLDVPRALHYARRLLEERFGGDPDRVQRLMERLSRAGTEEATARLMRSPLQVTIMALLVESLGQPPRERWRLFNDYYQVIFRREKERNIPAAELLSTYQADIDAIHQRVGLRLQVDSERSGGTEALLAQEEFARLVAGRLEEEGHKGVEGERLRQEIMDAALERLVFLVAPQAGKVGFEIRSLQEFMAAQALMNGSDEQIRQRLRAIAPAAHWRNVFLFAAGRCFHDRQHLRDSLHLLCCELNEGEGVAGAGELERAVLAGSQLALEILEDGSVVRQPAQLKLYARLALRLIELPPCPEQPRLARQYLPALADLYRNEIDRALSDGVPERRLGAWRVLLQLLAQGVLWAADVAAAHWPREAEVALLIGRVAEGVDISDWLAVRWCKAAAELPPDKSDFGSHRSWDWQRAVVTREGIPDWQKSLWHLHDRNPQRSLEINISELKSAALQLVVKATIAHEDDRSVELGNDNAAPEWGWLIDAVGFGSHASKERLAEMLSRWASLTEDTTATNAWFKQLGGVVPWPLAACCMAAIGGGNVQKYIDAARSGALGDSDIWAQAEERWKKQGLKRADFEYEPQGDLPFDVTISETGFPFVGSMATSSGEVSNAIPMLYKIWKELPLTPGRRFLANDLLFLLSIGGQQPHEINMQSIFSDLVEIISDSPYRWHALNILRLWPVESWQTPGSIDVLECLGNADQFWCDTNVEKFAPRLESLAQQHPENAGILNLLAATCVYGYRPRVEALAPRFDAFVEPRGQAAALLLRIAQQRWQESESATLAERLVALSKSRNGLLDDLMMLVDRHELAGRRIELLLDGIYSRLPCQDWEIRRKLLQTMQDRQRRRLSDSVQLPGGMLSRSA